MAHRGPERPTEKPREAPEAHFCAAGLLRRSRIGQRLLYVSHVGYGEREDPASPCDAVAPVMRSGPPQVAALRRKAGNFLAPVEGSQRAPLDSSSGTLFNDWEMSTVRAWNITRNG